MKSSSDHATDLGSLTPDAALALVAVLAEEMIERWRRESTSCPRLISTGFPAYANIPKPPQS